MAAVALRWREVSLSRHFPPPLRSAAAWLRGRDLGRLGHEWAMSTLGTGGRMLAEMSDAPLPSEASPALGDRLYHYTPREAGLGFVLPTGRIRLGLMRYLNDPREAKRWIVTPDDDVGGAEECPSTLEEILEFSDRFT